MENLAHIQNEADSLSDGNKHDYVVQNSPFNITTGKRGQELQVASKIPVSVNQTNPRVSASSTPITSSVSITNEKSVIQESFRAMDLSNGDFSLHTIELTRDSFLVIGPSKPRPVEQRRQTRSAVKVKVLYRDGRVVGLYKKSGGAVGNGSSGFEPIEYVDNLDESLSFNHQQGVCTLENKWNNFSKSSTQKDLCIEFHDIMSVEGRLWKSFDLQSTQNGCHLQTHRSGMLDAYIPDNVWKDSGASNRVHRLANFIERQKLNKNLLELGPGESIVGCNQHPDQYRYGNFVRDLEDRCADFRPFLLSYRKTAPRTRSTNDTSVIPQ